MAIAVSRLSKRLSTGFQSQTAFNKAFKDELKVPTKARYYCSSKYNGSS